MSFLYFFGSDRYASIVLDHLRTHSDLSITHFSDLKSFTNGSMVQWFNGSISSPPIGLSASFPHLFPPDVISAFNGQLYNLHPSLLPQYRNVAPVPYALAMGDQETGITLQKIDEKIDHGEIIAQITEPILPTDTTPILLDRLYTKGAQLFCAKILSRAGAVLRAQCNLESGVSQTNFTSEKRLRRTRSAQNNSPLIFTRKLTGESGHLEWHLVLKLINNAPITLADTANPLIKLRLTHFPRRTNNILPDLIRALDGYEKVWTVAPTRKGPLRISFAIGDIRHTTYDIRILLPGKPRPISWDDFSKYYL